MTHRQPLILLLALSLFTAACAGGDDAVGDDVPGPDAGTDERTLDNCTTDIAADAPAFYQQYFRCVTITVAGDAVTIETTSLPPHLSYYYGTDDPNYAPFDTSRGAQYAPNPNFLAAQNIAITIPAAPTPSGVTVTDTLVDGDAGNAPNVEYPGGALGVALDSVGMFSGVAAPGMDIADEAFTFDEFNAHPQMTGLYHYHTETAGPLEVLEAAGAITTTVPGDAELEVYGIFCDGTVILGCTELDGTDADGADLDAQGGHIGDLVDPDGVTHFTARYHTHVCADPGRGHLYTPEIQYYEVCER